MKITTSTDFLSGNDNASLETVLVGWMKEIDALHWHYTQVKERVGNETNRCINSVKNTYVNQCSISSLIALQIKMRTELERLLMEMEIDESASTGNMVKLKAHTLQLRSLNQQAQTRLLLSKTSAS
jgi:hypothetical protein